MLLAEPDHPVTARVRQLIDLVHHGRVREASLLTGISYPTLNDLYTGRTVNPNLTTLEALRAPYDIDLAWLVSRNPPGQVPRTGRVVFLPPHALADIKQRSLREVPIPFAAWSMYEVFGRLEARLLSMPATATRPIVAEASGDALVFRLATFLFQPLLAAEKAGEADVIPGALEGDLTDGLIAAPWIVRLRALGEMWKQVLPDTLEAPPSSAPAS